MTHFTIPTDVPHINLEILVLNFSKVKTSSGFYTTTNSSIESLASLTLKWPFSLNRQRCTSRWRTSVNLAYLVELRGYKDGNKLIDLRTISLLQEKKALLMYSSAWASILPWSYRYHGGTIDKNDISRWQMQCLSKNTKRLVQSIGRVLGVRSGSAS